MTTTLLIICFLIPTLALPVDFTQTPASSSPNAEKQNEWIECSLPDGRFVVSMPAKPVSQSVPFDSNGGRLVAHSIALDTQLESYAVTYIEFPDRLDDESKSKSILDGIRDAELAKVSGKLVKEADISIDAYRGREITIEAADGFWVDRLYLVRNRLYEISAFTSKAAPEVKEITEAQNLVIRKYLNSFKLNLQP